MRKLRILISAYACNPAATVESYPGEATLGWNLVRQISRFHDVWVITHIYNREAIEQAPKQGKNIRISFYYLTLPVWLSLLPRSYFGVRIYYWLWQIKAFFAARRLHYKFHFDIAHHITFNNDWMPSFIGALLPIPFIWGPVGGGQSIPKGLSGEVSLRTRINETIRSVAQWLFRHSFFRRRCVKKAKAILVCNEETKVKIPGKYINKVHLFPVNGISSEDLQTLRREREFKRPFCIMTAGRFDPIKGLGLSIEAFKIFSHKFHDSEFVIIGEGPEEIRLKKLVEDLELEENVPFVPWLTRKELLSRMHSCDVFVFPSFRDGGGAVVVEAMACGKPVVCLDAGGPGFHIQEQWGIKVAPKSPEYMVQEMARALERLYLDKDLRDSLGRAARKRAEEFYLWDRLGEKMQEIYEKELSGL